MRRNYKGKHPLGMLIFLALFAAAAAIIMLLWNAIVPALIGWSAVTYWKAAGLLLLCRLLFGGFGKMGFWHPMMMGHAKKHMGHIEEMREKMSGMSREERREYIRRRMEEFHGGPCCEPEAKPESAE